MCHDACPHPISGGAAIQELTTDIPLDRGAIPTFVVLPEQIPAPALLLIHDINGQNDFYRDVARRLANAGYIVALPDCFFRLGPPADASRESIRARGGQLVQADALADLRAIMTWLRDHKASTGQVGTIGFCMGGTLVMLTASRQPVPTASVAFYGFPVRDRTPAAPILASDEDEAANIASPLLGLWGDADAGVGMPNVTLYDDQLTRYGKPHEFEIYPGVGHGFLTFDPASENYPAAQEAWQRALRFLGEHLPTGDGDNRTA